MHISPLKTAQDRVPVPHEGLGGLFGAADGVVFVEFPFPMRG